MDTMRVAVRAAAQTQELPTTVEQALTVVDQLLTGAQVAERLGISRQAVHKRAAALGGVRVGSTWVFPAEAIAAEARARSDGE